MYTHQTYDLAADTSKTFRKFLLRRYAEADIERRKILTLYDRDGTSDAFYMTSRLTTLDDQVAVESNAEQPVFRVGFSLRSRKNLPRKPRSLDLLCRGGSFGRGLEVGGAVQNEAAVDFNVNTTHLYHASIRHAASAKLFLGSVDDHLYQAITGNPKKSP